MVAESTLILLVIAIIDYVEPFGPKMGPYDITIEKLETCENQGSGKVVFASRITNAGKGKYLYKGNFTLGVPVDEHFKTHLELQKWGNGGWRHKSLEHTAKNCEDTWKIIGDFMKSLMKSTGSSVDKCPIPADSYKAENWLIELNLEKTVPVMEYGQYRGIFKLYYKGEFVGCMMVYGETIPKAFG